MKKYLPINEVETLLGVSARTIQRYIQKRKLKSKRINGKRLVVSDSISSLKPEVSSQENTEKSKESATSGFNVPDGYVLIDKKTLDVLNSTISGLTSTQQLMMEKGFNLKELPMPNDATKSDKRQTKDAIIVNKQGVAEVKTSGVKPATFKDKDDIKSESGNKKGLNQILRDVFTRDLFKRS